MWDVRYLEYKIYKKKKSKSKIFMQVKCSPSEVLVK
jgi:hypothetical protein